MKLSKYQKDAAERIFWTAAEAVVAVAAVHAVDLPVELVPVATAGLAALKSWIAKRVGDPSSAGIPLWVEDAVKAAATDAANKAVKKAENK